MAKQISALVPPFTYKDFDRNWEAFFRAEQKWMKELQEDLPKTNKGDLVGEILAWQRVDGYAKYIVVRQSPLTLAHLYVDDAYTVEDALIRGLRVKDVREMVKARKRFKKAG